jgi:hypothetical protein
VSVAAGDSVGKGDCVSGDASEAVGSAETAERSAVAPVSGVVAFVASGDAFADAGDAFATRVGAAMVPVGVCVGRSPAPSSGCDVAVTTTIHGVCVGGLSVGSEVSPQPERTAPKTPKRTKRPNALFMASRPPWT